MLRFLDWGLRWGSCVAHVAMFTLRRRWAILPRLYNQPKRPSIPRYYHLPYARAISRRYPVDVVALHSAQSLPSTTLGVPPKGDAGRHVYVNGNIWNGKVWNERLSWVVASECQLCEHIQLHSRRLLSFNLVWDCLVYAVLAFGWQEVDDSSHASRP